MKTRIILLCSAALLSSAALANEAANDTDAKGAGATFKALDTDGDGKLSKDEAAANTQLSASFDKLDGNSDGFVSKREFQRNTMPRPKAGP